MSYWAGTDPTGLSGDTTLPEVPPYSPGMSFPGGFPSTGNTLTIPSVMPTDVATDAMSADLSPASSSNGLMGILSSLFKGAGSTGGGGGGGGGAGGIANILGTLFSLLGKGTSSSPSAGSGIGGAFGNTLSDEMQTLQGGAAGAQYGPWGALAGAALGDITSTGTDINSGRYGEAGGRWLGALLGSPLLGSFLGDLLLPAGIPREAKPESIVQALRASGNPVEDFLGQYIQGNGINRGYDLSGSPDQPFHWQREADVLQLLTGMGLPNQVVGHGAFENNPVLGGWKNLSQLEQMQPNMTRLSLNQIDQIRPLIAHLVNKSGGQSLQKLLGQENELATKLRQAESF